MPRSAWACRGLPVTSILAWGWGSREWCLMKGNALAGSFLLWLPSVPSLQRPCLQRRPVLSSLQRPDTSPEALTGTQWHLREPHAQGCFIMSATCPSVRGQREVTAQGLGTVLRQP